MTTYTDIRLKHAGEDELRQGFDCDDRIPGLVAAEFDEIAADGSLRFSLGKYTTDADIERAASIITTIVERERKAS